MATAAAIVCRRLWLLRPPILRASPKDWSRIRRSVTTKTGAFRQEPELTPYGIAKVVLTVLPGLYIGATVSKTGAAWLEENDIFVRSDDDDDDD